MNIVRVGFSIQANTRHSQRIIRAGFRRSEGQQRLAERPCDGFHSRRVQKVLLLFSQLRIRMVQLTKNI